MHLPNITDDLNLSGDEADFEQDPIELNPRPQRSLTDHYFRISGIPCLPEKKSHYREGEMQTSLSPLNVLINDVCSSAAAPLMIWTFFNYPIIPRVMGSLYASWLSLENSNTPIENAKTHTVDKPFVILNSLLTLSSLLFTSLTLFSKTIALPLAAEEDTAQYNTASAITDLWGINMMTSLCVFATCGLLYCSTRTVKNIALNLTGLDSLTRTCTTSTPSRASRIFSDDIPGRLTKTFYTARTPLYLLSHIFFLIQDNNYMRDIAPYDGHTYSNLIAGDEAFTGPATEIIGQTGLALALLVASYNIFKLCTNQCAVRRHNRSFFQAADTLGDGEFLSSETEDFTQYDRPRRPLTPTFNHPGNVL